jgi:histidine triad (HIT) family protein
MMDDCVFCKMVRGVVKPHVVYEDKDFYAFLDQSPVLPGHTLAIPKQHYRWVWDMPDELISRYYPVVKKIAKALKKAMATELVASSVEGIEVAHAHTHLIPKHPKDHGRFTEGAGRQKLSDEQMSTIAESIRKALK